MESAKNWKEKGNALVKQKKYKEALDCYSKAIEIDPKDPIFYSNRSLMHINLEEYDQAILDAEKAILLKPNYGKAYLRKGKALEGKQKMKEALDTYKLGLEKDKNNSELLNASSQVEASLKNMNLFKDPSSKEIMNDPNFKNILEFAKKDPKNFLQMIETATGIDFQKIKENEKKSTENDKIKNEESFFNDLQIKKEGNIIGQSMPMTKNQLDELFTKEPFLCKIQFQKKINGEMRNGNATGFFCYINDENIPFNMALFTNNHVLDRHSIGNGKYIQFKHMNIPKEILMIENRRAFTDEKLDYTCIELFESDGILNFFRIDTDLLNNEKCLIDQEIFVLQYPLKDGDLFFSSGRIKDKKKHYLIHYASTEEGSSGSPLIERKNNNLILGLHLGGHKLNNENIEDFQRKDIYEFNCATSFDEILKNIKLQLNRTISAIIEIKEDNFKARIINSFENKKKEYEKLNGKENEKEIKNSDIFINGEQIDWNYDYIFPTKGKYNIKYVFHDLLTSTSCLFEDCKNLIEIDLSYFNAENITNMSFMFGGCESLININLSNFKTENTTNMNYMFSDCKSLKSLDLSSFNTEKVVDMAGMFSSCRSLINLNLSNFITKNVTELDTMFMHCSNLTYLNLSNFTTEKVKPTLFIGIFLGCSSLKVDNLITHDKLLLDNFSQNTWFENAYKFWKIKNK